VKPFDRSEPVADGVHVFEAPVLIMGVFLVGWANVSQPDKFC
jgi:hypothetical protein